MSPEDKAKLIAIRERVARDKFARITPEEKELIQRCTTERARAGTLPAKARRVARECGFDVS